MKSGPANKQMQRTHGENGASPLICVLYRRQIYEQRLRIMRSHALHDH
jgi:hypothetical protein